MNKKATTLFAAFAAVSIAFGAPVVKRVPVAEGFPDWEGVTPKNRLVLPSLLSRSIVPSDLRQRVVVVVEMDIGDLKKFQDEQIEHFNKLSTLNAHISSSGTESLSSLLLLTEVPRGCIVLASLRGKCDTAELEKVLFPGQKNQAAAQKTQNAVRSYCPFYYNVTFAGAPQNTEGKYPFCYVLDGKGKEPVWKGVLTAKNTLQARDAAKKAVDALPTWTPLTGLSESEIKVHKTAYKQIKAGKIKAAKVALLAGIKSKDAATAAEAQTMYDAINQFMSDQMLLIQIESRISAAMAYTELQRLAKLFPAVTKELGPVAQTLTSNQSAQMLGKMIEKIQLWTSSDYNPKPAEAKKALQEIAKWKKALAVFEKGSPNMSAAVQGEALQIAAQLDTLKAVVESKLPTK